MDPVPGWPGHLSLLLARPIASIGQAIPTPHFYRLIPYFYWPGPSSAITSFYGPPYFYLHAWPAKFITLIFQSLTSIGHTFNCICPSLTSSSWVPTLYQSDPTLLVVSFSLLLARTLARPLTLAVRPLLAIGHPLTSIGQPLSQPPYLYRSDPSLLAMPPCGLDTGTS